MHIRLRNVLQRFSCGFGGNCQYYRSISGCPSIGRQNTFLNYLMRLLSSTDDLKNILEGCRVTDGIECMWGSAIYLMTTGISQSHARMVLSSEVVTNRLLSSTKVIVLTGPRCWSYSCVISPLFISYWWRIQSWWTTIRWITYLNDLFIRHSRQEDILFVFIRMKLNTERDLAVPEPPKAFSSLGIP